MFDSQQYRTRSQDLEEAWHDCGQFYWGTADAWRSGNSPYEMRACPLPIPRWRVQDIDTEEDWLRAEAMFSVLKAA
jgi:N-acylneuraminate cytidylyltransferase